jgi:hypothetical protein
VVSITVFPVTPGIEVVKLEREMLYLDVIVARGPTLVVEDLEDEEVLEAVPDEDFEAEVGPGLDPPSTIEAIEDIAVVKSAFGGVVREALPLGNTTMVTDFPDSTKNVVKVVFNNEKFGRVVIIGLNEPPTTLDAITETVEVKDASGTAVKETRPLGLITKGIVSLLTIILVDRVVFRAENSGRVVMVEVGGPAPTLDATLETAEVKSALGTTVKETRPPGPTTKGIVLLLTTMLVDKVVFRAENAGKVVMVGVDDPPATFDAIMETADVKAALGADARETWPPGATTIGTVEVPSVKNVERVLVKDLKAERVVTIGDSTVAEAPPEALEAIEDATEEKAAFAGTVIHTFPLGPTMRGTMLEPRL